jgi:hypothetical protein
MEPVPTAMRASAPRAVPLDAVFRVPLLSSRASQVLIRPSTALNRARDFLKHGPGLPSPAEEVLKSASKALEGGMNDPVGGISASEARLRHRVGGKRTKLGRARTKADRDQSPGHGPPALKILATREAVVGVTKEPITRRPKRWGSFVTPA